MHYDPLDIVTGRAPTLMKSEAAPAPDASEDYIDPHAGEAAALDLVKGMAGPAPAQVQIGAYTMPIAKHQDPSERSRPTGLSPFAGFGGPQHAMQPAPAPGVEMTRLPNGQLVPPNYPTLNDTE